ncbi:type II secretion system F family protein [Evansella halocellulosilytica]|uniref:type II secretion system F family protein n=1 Tax=Evansella halocellulosilytica TaxID=2011013 RepID=UPI0011559A47|nr:type II secretion system F family protein [Evansella halocellulosilytica]
MAIYQYEGRNREGMIESGKIKSNSEREAREALKKKGVAILEITLLEGILYKEISLFQRVKSKELVIFLRQFSTLLKAGISLVDSIHLLGEQTKNKLLKQTLVKVEEDIRVGTSFSEAAEKHRQVFPPLFTNNETS